MESTVDELGQLKYSIDLKISFQEIKPTYDAIYRELKNTRHNGFRRGKHPKGWLDKRFLSVMQKEAAEKLIPGYMEDALKKHSLKPATIPIIKKIEFNRDSPLCATLDFEIAPSLPRLDYSKINLQRKKIDKVTESEISKELEGLQKREEVIEPKEGNEVKVEHNDCVKINFSGSIEGKNFPGSKSENVQFVVGGEEFKEFHKEVVGMLSGGRKNTEVILSEQFAENEGKKANFDIIVKEIFVVKKPELDEKFFNKYGVLNLAELKTKIEESISSRKKAELQTSYRMAVSAQLSELYDDFDLPEQLIKVENEKIQNELEKSFSEKKISKEDKDKKINEDLENVKKDLRIKFILESISEHENLIFEENEAAKEFVGLAQMTGQSPDKLIQSQFGQEIYQRLLIRKRGDNTLDRVIARVFDDPIEQIVPKKDKHVHDKNCEHNH